MPTVFPTHSCFDDAVEILKKIMEFHPETFPTDEFLVVHAIVEPYGKPMAHAWIEDNYRNKVLFMGIIHGKREMLSADRMEFYIDIKMKETTKYTPLQAYLAEKRTRQFGPWEEKYQVLCRDKR